MNESHDLLREIPVWRYSLAMVMVWASLHMTVLAAALLPKNAPERTYMEGAYEQRKQRLTEWNGMTSDLSIRLSYCLLIALVAGMTLALASLTR